MSAFETLADHLVSEIPMTRLQSLLTDIPIAEVDPGGALCGGGCAPGGGFICGLSCRPRPTAQDVIDPDGELGLTSMDLDDIRKDLPRLRQAVVYQIEAHLGELK